MNRFNRKVTAFILFVIVVLLSLYSSSVRTFFVGFTSAIRSAYSDVSDSIKLSAKLHFDQAETIKRLQNERDRLEKMLLEYRSDASRFRYMQEALEMGPDSNATYEPVRPEGYARIGNFQRLWLDRFKSFDPDRNYGVVRNGFAAGIVVEQNSRPLMILAGDPECTFAVYIGKVRAPGIAMGSDERHMVVKYIPQWLKLKPGDEVVTSGLDHIFPPGIPVGRLLSTQKMQGFQNAYIELYADTLHPDFVWIVSPGSVPKSDS